jgi:hypothetical protein
MTASQEIDAGFAGARLIGLQELPNAGDHHLRGWLPIFAVHKAVFQASVQGVDAIVSMLARLLELRTLFVQLTHSGVISFADENTAIGRFTERERRKGQQDYYENLAVYRDELARQPNGWRFKCRFYQYRYIDTSAFAGSGVPPHPGTLSGVRA